MDGGVALQRRSHARLRRGRRDQGVDALLPFLFQDRIEQGDPSVLEGFRATLDGLHREDYRGKESAAFAFVEEATGMGLETEWPDVADAPVVILANLPMS